MPKIREYGSQVKQAETLPTRRATGEDFGAGTAQAIGQVGQSLGALGDAMSLAQQADSRSKLERVKSEHNSALLEAQFQLKNSPEYMDNPNKFTEVTTQLQEDAQKKLGEIGMYDQYVTDMGVTYEKSGINVRKDTIKRVTQQGKTDLNSSLESYTTLAANADGPDEQEEYLTKGNESIDAMAATGILNPIETGKLKSDFAKSTRTAIVGNMIESDPLTTAALATEHEGIFANMPETERQAYQKAAVAEYRDSLRFEQGQEDRRRNEIERTTTDAEEAVSNNLDEMFVQGELDLGTVMDSRDSLDPADYRFHLDRAVTGRKASTDAHLYSDLLLRAMRGENVQNDVKDAYRSYNLERGAFDHILSVYKGKSGFGSSGTPDKFKKAEEYVEKATKPNELNPSAGSARRQADSLKMLWSYMQENPNVNEQEALEQATTIVDRFSIINQGEFSINTPTPKLMVGSRSNIDVAATLIATDEAFNRGQLTQREYQFELNNLDQWDIHNDERNLQKEGAK